MDEEAYRRLYREVNDRQCLYEKAILANHCRCGRMQKLLLAEREAAHCDSSEGQQRCGAYLKALRKAMRFALKSGDEGAGLPHARAMRLQVGGMRGLYRALHNGEEPPVPIPNIQALLRQGLQRWDHFERFPFQQILREVATWEGRKPRRRRKC
jgi:hypothetical protein